MFAVSSLVSVFFLMSFLSLLSSVCSAFLIPCLLAFTLRLALLFVQRAWAKGWLASSLMVEGEKDKATVDGWMEEKGEEAGLCVFYVDGLYNCVGPSTSVPC